MSLRPAAGVTLPHDEDRADKIRAIVDPLMLSYEQEAQVMGIFQEEMWMGLSRNEQRRKVSSLQMENTYVRELLNGSEEGEFLALDLGGTNFRVLLCKIQDGMCTSISRNYNLPNEKLYGCSAGVFDHLAVSIHMFLTEEGLLSNTNIPLGFTFSFPMVQHSIKQGILVTWTKSFACVDGVGDDAVKLLEEALLRAGVTQVDVVAVLNDTTGTLLAGSYLDKECRIGLIMGTGCNAAYVERLDNVDKWDSSIDGDGQVVIDTECGAFGDNGSLDFIKTPFDAVVDNHSNWVGSFTFEKLFAGHYIGDLARLTFLRLVQDGLLLTADAADVLSAWGMFTATDISTISKDTETDTTETQRVLGESKLCANATSNDVATIRYVCAALTMRAAQLVSAAIATLLNHMAVPVCTVAIDGSLYRYHPKLHTLMTEKVTLLAPLVKSKFILAKDGSGRGAAFVAAVAQRMSCSDCKT